MAVLALSYRLTGLADVAPTLDCGEVWLLIEEPKLLALPRSLPVQLLKSILMTRRILLLPFGETALSARQRIVTVPFRACSARHRGASSRSPVNSCDKRRALPPVALALCLATIACDTQQYAAAIGDFGTASATVIQQTRNAYKLVNDTVLQQQILTIADRSTPIQTNPAKEFTPFLPDEDLAIRGTLLDGLQAYAAALGNLTGKTTSDLDSETTKLAGALKDLGMNDRLQHSFREVKSITPEAFNGGAVAVEAIGNFLINRKIARDLPAILTKTEPTIEAIAALFIHEIGDVPTSGDPGGLRGKLWRTYDSLIEQQTLLVNRSSQGSAEKRQDVTALAELLAAQRNADAGLAGTQAALRKLIASHQALLKVQTAPATFKTVIASLWAEAKAAQDFYAKLPSK